MHDDLIVKQAEGVMFRRRRVMHRGVVAKGHQLGPLQPKDAPCLRPAAVIADTHPHVPAETFEHAKAEVAGLKIAFLQMLEGTPRLVLTMSRQMNLAVFTDDLAVFVDHDGGIETAQCARFIDQFGIAKLKADPQAFGLVE